MTKSELEAERAEMVTQLHAAQAILDAILDRITIEPKRKSPAKQKKKGK
jgi:hypothetical protein